MRGVPSSARVEGRRDLLGRVKGSTPQVVCHPARWEQERRWAQEEHDQLVAMGLRSPDSGPVPKRYPPGPDQIRPCIIFMDSLKMHSPARVERYLMAFFEIEWKKRKPKEDPLDLKRAAV